MADTPIPVGVRALALTGAAPTVAASSLVVRGDVVMHLFIVESAIDQGLFMPMMTMEASGLTGETTNVFQLPLSLPLIEVTGTIDAGCAVEAAITMPVIELYASNGSAATMTLPLPSVEATVVSGITASAALTLPVYELSAVGQHTQSAVDIDIPLYVVTSTVLQGGSITGDITFPVISAVATVQGGQTIVAALELPMMEVSGSIYGAVQASADLQLPLYLVDAELYNVVTETFRAFVMNVETEAISTYSGYGYNSFAKIGDSYFAASADGIVELTGDTDDGDAIAATLTFKKDNFGSGRESRVVGAYLCADLSDDMRFGLTANGNDYVYEVPAHGARGLATRRIDTVKGEKAIYWQATLTNVNGSDFRVTSLELIGKKLARRI